MSADLHYNACPIIANASQAGHFAVSDMLLVLLTCICYHGLAGTLDGVLGL